MSDSDKINEVLKVLKSSSVNEFAIEIGLSGPQVIYNIQKGKNKISKKLARRITDRFPQISYDWLIDDSGEMLIEQGGSDNMNISMSGSNTKISKSSIAKGYANNEAILLNEINQLKEQIVEYKKREEQLIKDKEQLIKDKEFLQDLIKK